MWQCCASVFSRAGLGIASLLIALLVRLLFTYVCVLFAGFNIREKLFIALAWMPKATVQVFSLKKLNKVFRRLLVVTWRTAELNSFFNFQAAIGSTALDMARTRQDEQMQKYGIDVLTVAVLSILLTAPVGALIIGLCGPCLLQKPKNSSCGERVKPNLSAFFLGR